MAIKEWVKLNDGQSVPLERALASFDHFVLHEREGDIEEVSARIDSVAESIRLEHPDIAHATPRRKARLIATYLCRHGLTGIADSSEYRNLQNNFIGLALNSDGRAALPLISVGIFCSVAKRFSLVAQPCTFPFHVYAIVMAPHGQALDGRPLGHDSAPEIMYMDPFRSEGEVFRNDLEAQLRTMGVPHGHHEMLLGVSSTAEMVRRTARNIIESIQTTRNIHDLRTSSEPRYPEADGALYGALWALLLLPDENESLFQRARYQPYLMDHLEKQFLFDVQLVEMYMLPQFLGSQHSTQLLEALQVIRIGDSMPKQVKRRTPNASKSVQFKVGQVFRHKRYNYQGVITGWDVECAAGETWMSQMGVDRLSRGRHQSFYHALVEDKSVRYVAEENIVDTEMEVGVNLMRLAGRHFKRWDQTSKTFISNIKDEYPDD
ncbi:MAG: hypothetical protein Q9210_001347 [Variospora velana]